MANTSNENHWAARARLRQIEVLLWWRGWVGRGDLTGLFGISAAQASSDLQRYAELNPGALAYNVRSKRYESGPAMRCVLHEPRLEEAVGLLLGEPTPMLGPMGVGGSGGRLALCLPPQRRNAPEVERAVFLAIYQNRRLELSYASVKGAGGRWRMIAPHALGHDGLRWHVRAWCFENGDYRDFVLTRIEEQRWPGELFEAPMPDAAWERKVTLVFVPNQELGAEARAAIELDYGMKNGCLEFTVREAMVEYQLALLRIREVDGARPRHLDLVR